MQGDHPRLRGEHYINNPYAIISLGSPPPTRGTPLILNLFTHPPRITPTYAGNTTELPQYANYDRDHPRLRGEHFIFSVGTSISLGSPPPTRGTLFYFYFYFRRWGITPAYAGNTNNRRGRRVVLWDHPRLRGERALFGRFCLSKPGSPPPTRGTLIVPNNKVCYHRITPAYAGNTCPKYPPLRLSGDHPRLRGEHS